MDNTALDNQNASVGSLTGNGGVSSLMDLSGAGSSNTQAQQTQGSGTDSQNGKISSLGSIFDEVQPSKSNNSVGGIAVVSPRPQNVVQDQPAGATSTSNTISPTGNNNVSSMITPNGGSAPFHEPAPESQVTDLFNKDGVREGETALKDIDYSEDVLGGVSGKVSGGVFANDHTSAGNSTSSGDNTTGVDSLGDVAPGVNSLFVNNGQPAVPAEKTVQQPVASVSSLSSSANTAEVNQPNNIEITYDSAHLVTNAPEKFETGDGSQDVTGDGAIPNGNFKPYAYNVDVEDVMAKGFKAGDYKLTDQEISNVKQLLEQEKDESIDLSKFEPQSSQLEQRDLNEDVVSDIHEETPLYKRVKEELEAEVGQSVPQNAPQNTGSVTVPDTAIESTAVSLPEVVENKVNPTENPDNNIGANDVLTQSELPTVESEATTQNFVSVENGNNRGGVLEQQEVTPEISLEHQDLTNVSQEVVFTDNTANQDFANNNAAQDTTSDLCELSKGSLWSNNTGFGDEHNDIIQTHDNAGAATDDDLVTVDASSMAMERSDKPRSLVTTTMMGFFAGMLILGVAALIVSRGKGESNYINPSNDKAIEKTTEKTTETADSTPLTRPELSKNIQSKTDVLGAQNEKPVQKEVAPPVEEKKVEEKKVIDITNTFVSKTVLDDMRSYSSEDLKFKFFTSGGWLKCSGSDTILNSQAINFYEAESCESAVEDKSSVKFTLINSSKKIEENFSVNEIVDVDANYNGTGFDMYTIEKKGTDTIQQVLQIKSGDNYLFAIFPSDASDDDISDLVSGFETF